MMQKQGRLPGQTFRTQPYDRFKAISPLVDKTLRKLEESPREVIFHRCCSCGTGQLVRTRAKQVL